MRWFGLIYSTEFDTIFTRTSTISVKKKIQNDFIETDYFTFNSLLIKAREQFPRRHLHPLAKEIYVLLENT